jgi:hypothetical protein
MKDCFITFRSVTYAQRGESELRRAGISCNVWRTPRWMEEQGCGYSIRLRCQDVTVAVELLKRKNVPYRKVYLHGADGELEERLL